MLRHAGVVPEAVPLLRRLTALPSFTPDSLLMQAIILQGQVKAQADKDVAAYEAEWRQLTALVEGDRRRREAQRARELAAREAQMAALFRQEVKLPANKQRRSTVRASLGATAGAGAASGAAAGGQPSPGDAALATGERVRQLKEQFAAVLAATGGCRGGEAFGRPALEGRKGKGSAPQARLASCAASAAGALRAALLP